MISYCYRKIDTSIVLLNEMKNEYDDFPNMNIQVISNCYASDFDLQSGNLFQKKNRVVYLSNIMKSKGILDFLDACEVILTK